MKFVVRIIAFIMVLILISTALLSCNQNSNEEGEADDKNIVNTNKKYDEDKYADVDFGGKTFVIHSNTFEYAGYTNSNRYIQGFDDLSQCQSVVDEAVFTRNITMEEDFNMSFEFITESTFYEDVVSTLNPLLLSGEPMDLYIDNLFPLTNMSIEGSFKNIANNSNINYFEDYWYNDFMSSLSLDGGSSMYLLAGDYFMDFIQSANVMMVNLELLDSNFVSEGGSEVFLQKVIDGEWTYEMMNMYMQNAYRDDGDGEKDDQDKYGLTISQYWAPMIAMIASAKLTCVEENGSEMKFALNNEKARTLHDNMIKILKHDATVPMLQYSDYGFETTLNEKDSFARFQKGQALFSMEQRFAHMIKMASVDLKYSVLPYPKLDVLDEYVTPAHDTTNVGAIPYTCQDINSVLLMLEIACDLTHGDVMVKYYDDGLKLKYSADPTVAQVVDIIHDNILDGFILAYNYACGGVFQRESFYNAFCENQSFATKCQSLNTMANTKLNDMLKKWDNINN